MWIWLFILSLQSSHEALAVRRPDLVYSLEVVSWQLGRAVHTRKQILRLALSWTHTVCLQHHQHVSQEGFDVALAESR